LRVDEAQIVPRAEAIKPLRRQNAEETPEGKREADLSEGAQPTTSYLSNLREMASPSAHKAEIAMSLTERLRTEADRAEHVAAKIQSDDVRAAYRKAAQSWRKLAGQAESVSIARSRADGHRPGLIPVQAVADSIAFGLGR
jgi:hypothetical protein